MQLQADLAAAKAVDGQRDPPAQPIGQQESGGPMGSENILHAAILEQVRGADQPFNQRSMQGIAFARG